MKRMGKVLAGLVLVILVLLTVLFLLSRRPAVGENYREKMQAGPLEAQYLADGPYTVLEHTIQVPENFREYTICWPEDPDGTASPWPVVIFSNGTGVPVSDYLPILRHLASWGFITVGTEEEYSWNGFSSEMCLRLMMKLNDNATPALWEDNPLYGKIDLDHIGAAGHSQGGVGAINAATHTDHAGMYRAVYAASTTHPELASTLEWDYDPALLTVPVLFTAGTGDTDSGTILPLDKLRALYAAVPENVPKGMMRKSGADHGEMLWQGDGYMTAWFLWHLKGDEQAARLFTEELPASDHWQDVEKNF